VVQSYQQLWSNPISNVAVEVAGLSFFESSSR